MRTQKHITIGYEKGIHTRVAATIVQKTTELEERYGCRLYIKRENKALIVPCNSVLPLVGMKLKKGESIEIFGDGTTSRQAVTEMSEFISQSGDLDKDAQDAVDNIIQKNTLTSEKIFESIDNGLIVIDAEGRITIFNRSAQRMTGIDAEEAIGRKVETLIPGFAIEEIIKTGKEKLGMKEKLYDRMVIIDKSPVVVEGSIVGAVAVFQDISMIEALSWELNSVKELEGKLVSILEAVYDGISLIDKNNRITYVNKAFAGMLHRKVSELTEQNISTIFSGEKTPTTFFDRDEKTILTNADGREFMLDIRPISVDGVVNGNAVVARELTEITKLASKVEELSAQTIYLQEELEKRQDINASFQTIIGQSGVLLEALSLASKASKTDASVLIRGESGTGKELVAKAIHYAGKRKDKAFIGVNCAAIPSDLLESELFGYEKGAFTGAVKAKPGKFELADGGTIFLDEIGDMDMKMQAKLLRVLQEQEIERVGGLHPIQINVRIIAATNASLEKLMENKEFRKDLYYRLNVISVVLPPLRQRKGDIPLLVEAFVDKICMRYQLSLKRITKTALECLETYEFPGNVRELENIIERGVTLTGDEWIGPEDLPPYININGENEPKQINFNAKNGDKIPTYEEMERQLITIALAKYKTFRKAGEALGLDHKTVSAKAKKFGLT
ncbi:MAG: sigma 54-interacting transcriptional regulator [Eubacterium sp.]